MVHMGDITKISGFNVPPVDVVIGGSPCQDLSVAGKQKGFAGSRSGLFMEQIRLIKEMRKADAGRGRADDAIRPRFMLWENVPGAFSSNRGEDFKAVLEETIRIAEPNAPDIPLPCGGWPLADAYYGEGWSVAYRVLDAQFWGAPQRRRRIALVADFGGHAAPEILFVRKSVSGHFEQMSAERKSDTCGAGNGAGEASVIGFSYKAGAKARSMGDATELAPTLSAERHDAAVLVVEPIAVAQNQRGELRTMKKMPSLTTGGGKPGEGYPCVLVYPINDKATRFQGGGATRKQDGSGNGLGIGKAGDPSPTLTAADRHIVFATQQFSAHKESTAASCIQAQQYKNATDIVITTMPPDVRRLTPLECERLQGFPDGWTDIGGWVDEKGKHHPESSDAARYKALGNSIAIPPWKWVIKRLCSVYERDATMASLFDGIGGFPYIWEQFNGKGSCLWVSEIEQFPIAVTKFRFGTGG